MNRTRIEIHPFCIVRASSDTVFEALFECGYNRSFLFDTHRDLVEDVGSNPRVLLQDAELRQDFIKIDVSILGSAVHTCTFPPLGHFAAVEAMFTIDDDENMSMSALCWVRTAINVAEPLIHGSVCESTWSSRSAANMATSPLRDSSPNKTIVLFAVKSLH